jgi:outer membrane protein assembly factor BamB
MRKHRKLVGIIFILVIFSLLSTATGQFTQNNDVNDGNQSFSERWKIRANQPDGTSGQPTWKSAVAAGGIIYIHTHERYTISHGNGEGIEFDSIYAVAESSGAKLWVFTNPQGLSNPTIYQGVLYTNNGSTFFALDATTGQTKWTYAVPGFIQWQTEPSEGVICFAIAGDFFYPCFVSGVNETTGMELWRVEFGFNYGFQMPAAGNGRLFFGTEEHYYAYNLQSGQEIWKLPVTSFSPFSDGDAQAKLVNGRVYFETGSEIYSVNAQTGDALWSYKIEDYSIGEAPVVDGGTLYSINYKEMWSAPTIFALDVSNGQKIWNYSVSGHWILEYPAAFGSVFHFGRSIQQFYGLNAATGQVIWTYGNALPVVGDGVMYYFNPLNETLEACNPLNGDIVWSSPKLPYSWFIALQDNVAYFGWNSYFYALNVPSTGLPTHNPTPYPAPIQNPSSTVNTQTKAPVPSDNSTSNPSPESYSLENNHAIEILVPGLVTVLVVAAVLLFFFRKSKINSRKDLRKY